MEQMSLFSRKAAPGPPPAPAPASAPMPSSDLPIPAFLGDLDRAFADFILRLAGTSERELWLGAAIASHGTSQGRVCTDLSDIAGKPWPLESEDDGGSSDPPETAPELTRWLDVLRASSVVGAPGELRPLIVDAKARIYLYRYWEYEQRLAHALRERAARRPGDVDARRLHAAQELLATRLELSEEQRIAAVAAVLRSLTIVSGGAGTGKTTIVAAMLKLLGAQAAGRPFHVRLAAPTGKAANRLREQIQALRETIDPEGEIAAVMRDQPATIHRLLGGTPDSTSFRHHAQNPLALDALIVDETSMVDLALMAKLVDALPAHARLILIGDKDQLPPVEVGSVLGELCGRATVLSDVFRKELETATGLTLSRQTDGDAPLRDTAFLLTQSRRFKPGTGIAALAETVRSGSVEDLAHVVEKSFPDLSWRIDQDTAAPSPELLRAISDGFLPYLDAVRANRPTTEILRELNRFRILCARRDGPWGIGALNELVEFHLRSRRRLETGQAWYVGRPVIVTRNDYNLRLFNGDVGVALREGGRDGRTRVWFEGSDGELRSVPPGRLSHVETAWAMTVHKSQGSEFERVLLVLPGAPSRLMTRELLYTAVTRARSALELVGPRDRLVEGLSRTLPRSSALREVLTSSTAG